MTKEREEYIDLIIAFIPILFLWELIKLETQIPSDFRFTIGMLADRARELLLTEMKEVDVREVDVKEVAPKLNVHAKTVKAILERLRKNQP